jgi:large-conductance mechanosensitive channel
MKYLPLVLGFLILAAVIYGMVKLYRNLMNK